MSADKKIRPEAVLKNLPPERQEALYDLIITPGQTLKSVREHLADDGIKVSQQTISEFRSWYSQRLQFMQWENRALTMMDLLRKTAPDLPEAKVSEYGASVFNLQAIEQNDPKTFLKIQTARHKAEMDKLKFQQKERQIAQRQETLELDKKRFQRETAELFLKWAADRRAKEIATSNESNAKKIERLGELMFGEDWSAPK